MTHASGYAEIERVIRDSDYGQELSGRARYNKYRHPSTSLEEWFALLGRDVNNLEHMPLTRGIALAFVRHTKTHQPELLDPGDEHLYPVTGSMHDLGEAITIDKSYGDKGPEDDAEELQALDVAGASLYPDGYPPFFEDAKAIVFDHTGETKRGEVFFAIECLGYMRTAMNAMDHVLEGTAPYAQVPGLQWLYTDVVTNITSELISQAEKFDAVRAALIAHVERIDIAFGLIDLHPVVFKNYAYKGEDQPRLMHEKALLAREAWREFRESLELSPAV